MFGTFERKRLEYVLYLALPTVGKMNVALR
jgi:hypothetical protein